MTHVDADVVFPFSGSTILDEDPNGAPQLVEADGAARQCEGRLATVVAVEAG